MRKSVAIVMLGALLIVPASSCATLTKGSSQIITVSSNVEGAEVYLDGNKIGTTPFTGTVSKGKSTLRVEKSGYRGETLALSKTLEPTFWGNIILGGTLGSITDFATGAAYQYAPASYQVELRAEGQPEDAFLKQLGVRKFAMVYIDEISEDIATGGGNHLSALIQLMNGDSAVADPAAVRAALESSRGFPVTFGQELVDLL